MAPHMKKDDKKPSEDHLKDNLWRCDCVNEGKDTNPNKHQSKCGYLLWYSIRYNGGSDEEGKKA